ncbi:MAG: DUF11 domain-containing protein [Candidatus Binatia bacterium]
MTCKCFAPTVGRQQSVQNTGPDGASGVVLTDPLPSGTTYVSVSPSQGLCSHPAVGAGGTVQCSLGSLSSGASATITLAIRVRGGLLLGIRTVTNVAAVSGGPPDPNLANNTAAASTLVVTVLGLF